MIMDAEIVTVLSTQTQLIPLPMFQDNYLWVVVTPSGETLAVDVGDYDVLETFLIASRRCLTTVLVTHHHPDHTAGLPAVRSRYPDVRIFGPEGISGITDPVKDGDKLSLGDLGVWQVIDTRGHTAIHLSYYNPLQQTLFCGDTLFSAGCGRILGGDIHDLYRSLTRLAALPPETLICPAHEYTLSNIAFARAAEPDNGDLLAYQSCCQSLRLRGLPTLPTFLNQELKINPFLRTHLQSVRTNLPDSTVPITDSEMAFVALRHWKDHWKA